MNVVHVVLIFFHFMKHGEVSSRTIVHARTHTMNHEHSNVDAVLELDSIQVVGAPRTQLWPLPPHTVHIVVLAEILHILSACLQNPSLGR